MPTTALRIDATLNPAEVDYMFFVARPAGSHIFPRTLDEHNRARVAVRRMREQAGRAQPPAAQQPPQQPGPQAAPATPQPAPPPQPVAGSASPRAGSEPPDLPPPDLSPDALPDSPRYAALLRAIPAEAALPAHVGALAQRLDHLLDRMADASGTRRW